MSLRQRRLEPELIDDPALAPEQHFEALQGLENINRWSSSLSTVWPPLAALAQQCPERTFRVLDLATGAGDIPIGICQRAGRAGVRLQVSGCDRSPIAVTHACRRARQAGVEVDFFTLDALREELPGGYDVVMCSLFLHHLKTEQAQHLLARMGKAAGRMIVVSDLLRGYAGLFLAKYVTPLLTPSKVVRADGPQSVRGAFTLAEAGALASRAGLDGFSLVPQWPCRFLLTWQCPAISP